MPVRVGLAAIVALAAAACSGPTSPLGVANGTTVAVAIAVNGTVVEIVPAGETVTAIPGVLPARPWTIEARSSSGRLLATLTVSASDDISATSGQAVSEDLACGRLELWAGGPHGGEPVASQGSPKPCD